MIFTYSWLFFENERIYEMSVIFPYKTKKFLFYIFPDLIPVLLRFLMRRLFLSPQCAALYHHQFNWKRDKKQVEFLGIGHLKGIKPKSSWESGRHCKLSSVSRPMLWWCGREQNHRSFASFNFKDTINPLQLFILTDAMRCSRLTLWVDYFIYFKFIHVSSIVHQSLHL